MTSNPTDILSNLQLSVQASLNGLSFCILDTTEKNIVWLKDFIFESPSTPIELERKLQELFNSEALLLQQTFSKVTLVHQNNLLSFVPNALLNTEKLKNYLNFSHKIFENDFVANDEITGKEITAVYVPFVNINNFFFEQFGSFNYLHANYILVKELLQQSTIHTHKLFCHIESNSYQLVYIKDGKLQLFNSFEISTAEDYIYYLLFSIEQLAIDPETIELVFLGNVGLNSPIYSYAYQYIRNVSFGSRETQFIYRNPEYKPKYGYDYFSLLNTF